MTKEDLQKFCNIDRENIAAPFTQGGFTYATDGRIIIRVPILPDVPENPAAPKRVDETLFATTPCLLEDIAWQSLDIPPLAGPSDCETCSGMGQHVCKGCDAPHDCGDCDGRGVNPENALRVKLGKHEVSHLILNKLITLPNLAIRESASGPLDALSFFFDGGDGRFMPMKPDDCQVIK